MLALIIIPLLSLLLGVLSRPIFGLGASTGAPTPVSLDGTPQCPAQFARVAYCSGASITTWTYGAPCDALKNITPRSPGAVRPILYYIAHDAVDQSLVVAHEGTDAKNILSILNDAQFGLAERSTENITVHDGFQQTFERTGDSLLAGVMDGLKSTGVKKIVVTGHSLGAALATMAAVMIKDAVDPSVDVSMTGFGLPRGGNQGWADFLDSQLGLTFVSNQNDLVPTVPPKFLGFQHSSGKIHIVDDSQTNLVAFPACILVS
ncbi:alpha/beta-hydrolase [Mycena leptocephala]|nr:alpha/beta-hydrolase [Mycena leptocephala]